MAAWTKLYGLVDSSDGFRKWAENHGAVSLTYEDWKALKQKAKKSQETLPTNSATVRKLLVHD